MKRAARSLPMLLLATVFGACVGGPNDRSYVEDLRYREARRAFERTQSTELTRQALEDAHWPDAQVNEAIYRIEKEFGLNDELPSPVKIRGEEELRAEELRDSLQVLADQQPTDTFGLQR